MQFKIERYTVFILFFFPDFENITTRVKQVKTLAAIVYAESAPLCEGPHDDRIAGRKMQRMPSRAISTKISPCTWADI